MEGILEQASTQLLQYGVLGVICILLIIGIAWLVLDQRRLTNERNAFYDEKLREIEE